MSRDLVAWCNIPLWEHSRRVGWVVDRLYGGEVERIKKLLKRKCNLGLPPTAFFVAGLLHDIGKSSSIYQSILGTACRERGEVSRIALEQAMSFGYEYFSFSSLIVLATFLARESMYDEATAVYLAGVSSLLRRGSREQEITSIEEYYLRLGRKYSRDSIARALSEVYRYSIEILRDFGYKSWVEKIPSSVDIETVKRATRRKRFENIREILSCAKEICLSSLDSVSIVFGGAVIVGDELVTSIELGGTPSRRARRIVYEKLGREEGEKLIEKLVEEIRGED